MSIPKEPRQLMINLMYLVLTALLALNVSAEVMNAFFQIDKGLKATGEIVASNNEQVLSNIAKQAEAYKKPENDQYLANAQKANKLSKDFVDYIAGIRDELFEGAGGEDPKNPGKPKRKKDKDVTTRLLVMGDPATPEDDGYGFEIEKRVDELRTQLLELVDNDTALVSSLPLGIEALPEKTDKTSWADYQFRQLPVAAAFPILGKLQSDAKASASAVLNHLFKKVSGEDIKFDAFEPVISAKKGYVIAGEPYEAEVFLSAYSTQSSGNTRILVNGSSLPVKDGKATFKQTPSNIGSKSYNVEIRVTNPLTQEVKSYKKSFEYEVGRRSATVSADKMNVFYIGVKNPISVAAAGVNSNELRVNGSGGGIKLAGTGTNKYDVTVTQPGEATITLSGGGLKASNYAFRVKRIPDPFPFLGNKKGGSMGTGEFKAQEGLRAVLDNFDFDARCNIQGFEIARVPKRADPIIERQQGGRFQGNVSNIVRAAKPGDIYYFDNIKARCPGDKAGRDIGSMVFKIR